MKTKEEILNEHLSTEFLCDNSIEGGSWLTEPIYDAMESYASEQTEKYKELIEWLNDECPAVSPPLEPYTTADLSHDFAEKLRTKLDDLKNELGL